MKKLIIILLVIGSVISIKASAAIKVVDISHNLSKGKQINSTKELLFRNSKIKSTTNSKINFNVRYIVFGDNGYLYLLAIYDNGGTTLTLIGPMFMP